MGNADQAPLGIDLLQPAQVKPAEAHIVLDVSKDSLNFHRTLLRKALPASEVRFSRAWRRYSSSLKLTWMRRLPFAWCIGS
jgi:hypothetical protein